MNTIKNMPLTNEDALNLELSIVSLDEGNNRIENGRTHLRLNGEVIPENLATLSKANLEYLYDQVKEFAQPEKKCLTGLRIHYGAEDDGGEIKMKLFYRPVYLAYTNYLENTHSYLYSIKEQGELCQFVNDEFTVVTPQEYTDSFDLLKNTLTMKHTLNEPSFEPYIDGTDVDNILISFQTLFTLLVDNDNDFLVLKNCVEIVLNEESNSVKQALLMFTEEVNPQGAFAGQYANRGIWGPPQNLEFGFTLSGY